MAYQPHTPLCKVELSIECSDLANLDTLGKSDPQVHVYLMDKTSTWRLIGKTEQIRNTLNPKFTERIALDYYFEEVQRLRFVVLDIDKPKNGVENNDFIGEMYCTLGDIMGCRGYLSRNLQNPKRSKCGVIFVRGEEVKNEKTTVHVVMSCNHLDKKDTFGKSDPYMTISRILPDGTTSLVHKTEVIKNTLDPTWREFYLPLSRLSGGDLNAPLLFQCFDWDRVGSHDFIGECRMSVQDIINRRNGWELINPKKASKKKSYTNSGVLNFLKFDLVQEPTFLDYLAGGTEISLMVSIDFTASNGNPNKPDSLHRIDPQVPNEYARAIMSVGEILAGYNSDKMYPVYGFGAKLPPDYKTSHLFPLTFDPSRPEVLGVQGILSAYWSAISKVILHGPTNFAPTIAEAARRAAQFYQMKHDVQAYLILLIITDGEITDMEDTLREIINASMLPMSIVIVGVGGADFTKMEILDGDDGRLSSGGRVAARDIVQFVPMRQFAGDPYRLASEVLAEIPKQFLEFMRANGIKPRPPPTVAELQALWQKQLASSATYTPVTWVPPK